MYHGCVRQFIIGLLAGFAIAIGAYFLKPAAIIRQIVTVPVAPSPTPEVKALLPDLAIQEPQQLFIRRQANGRALRFDTSTMNIGEGPFEVLGHHDKERNQTFASQYVKLSDGTGRYKEVGAFVFHPTHNHWHVENYVKYELLTVNENNEPGEKKAESEKISSCFWDRRVFNLDLPSAAKVRNYPYSCTQTSQGISVGWADIYEATFDGQEIIIDAVPDGRYFLRYQVNPDNIFEEKDTANNTGVTLIEISGNRVSKVE